MALAEFGCDRPWQHRSSISRDPDFGAKAARVLDLYAALGGALQVRRVRDLRRREDSIQARIRRRRQQRLAGQCRCRRRYPRGGALAYLAAWDMHAAGVRPLRSARGIAIRRYRQGGGLPGLRLGPPVFWVVDNSSPTAARPASTGSKTAGPPLADPPARTRHGSDRVMY